MSGAGQADGADLVVAMLRECLDTGQSVRRVPDADADPLRAALRQLARAGGHRVRTAHLDGTVALVRTDAAIWQDDAATMRARLTPREDGPEDGAAGTDDRR